MKDTNDGGQGGGFEPITTKEQLDAVIAERVEQARREAAPDDYEDLKARAERLSDAEDRAEKAEAEVGRLRHDAEVEGWKASVSAETGVPASVLRGESLEDIRSHAEAIKGSMPVYPTVAERAGADAQPMSKQQILSIKNPRERKAAILANLEQF